MGADNGDDLYAWQEQTGDGKWGIIAGYIPMIGLPGQLIHRREDIVRQAFGPIARQHVAQTGNPLRMVRFRLGEVLEQR